MYRVSGKQLLILVLASGLLAGAIVACAQRAFDRGSAGIERPVIADPSVASDEQNNIEVYKAVSPGVVNITNTVYTRNIFGGIFPSEGTGSGSIIDKEGHILTNYHVVQSSSQLEVQIEGDKYPARIVGTDPDNDIAVIQVTAPRDHLTVVKLGTSKGLQVGQKVLAIGNPFGLQRTLTTGVISGLERPIRDPETGRSIEGAIQTDASINPGNSGGPLLNARGEIVGINTSIYSTSGGSIGIGFAVPVDIAQKIIPELLAKGYVARPWLGISTAEVNPGMARAYQLDSNNGLAIVNVYRGTGAAAAGLKGVTAVRTAFEYREQIGDVIVGLDGKKIGTRDDLQNALKDKKAGDTVQLELLRQGRRVTVPVRLSERPTTNPR
ncbi:MAG TPA: trypsin-like peptidase domain-containing protein [Blastocatellia bacterium]|nr:trypsin-like peptidase domain-containing protein [Blastocatellia bacterium]